MKPVAGIGLRSPHLAEIGRERPATGFLEIHAENYLAGSPALQAVERLRADYDFSVHAVGLSLGSADGLDEAHLARVAALVKRLEPAWVSDHLSWSVIGGRYFNDLLPLPYTEEALDVVVRNVGAAAGRAGPARSRSRIRPAIWASPTRPCPNPSSWPSWSRRSGCGLLLDVNNIVVTAHNLRLDPRDWLAGLPAAAITQYHLAGHAVNDADGEPILIDDHGCRVSDGVWTLFAEIVTALRRPPDPDRVGHRYSAA